MTNQWDDRALTRVLQEMRASERIPVSARRPAIREHLVQGYGVYLYVFETQWGWMGLAQSPRGVCSVKLPRHSRAQIQDELDREFPTGRISREEKGEAVSQLENFIRGQQSSFELEVDLSALKPFQQAVLDVTRNIPFGETRSYSWVAHKIGHPGAARAVGHALAKNPIPIIIPCHRVIASDHSLRGYAGGLEMKQRLLELEGAALALSR